MLPIELKFCKLLYLANTESVKTPTLFRALQFVEGGGARCGGSIEQ